MFIELQVKLVDDIYTEAAINADRIHTITKMNSGKASIKLVNDDKFITKLTYDELMTRLTYQSVSLDLKY